MNQLRLPVIGRIDPWYVRAGWTRPFRLLSLLIWALVFYWSIVNLTGTVAGFATVPIIRTASDRTDCGWNLWDLVPNSPVLSVFPGLESHGILGTLAVFLSNGLWLLISLGILQWQTQQNGPRKSIKVVLANILGLIAIPVVFGGVLVLHLILMSAVRGMTGNPNTVDLVVPGVCRP